MKSRISFFNSTVFKKNIIRFCPIWIVYLVVQAMSCFGSISSELFTDGALAYTVGEAIGGMSILNLAYAFICAISLFGDLFNHRLCNALHALPLRRETWFGTHLLSGFLFSLVPNLLAAAVTAPFMGKLWYISALWLLGMTAEFLFYFALAVLCIMLCGSKFAAMAVYTIVNFFSQIVYWFVTMYYAPLLPGLHIRSTVFDWFCPTVLLTNNTASLVKFREVETRVDSNFGFSYTYHYEFDGLGGDWWYIAILAGLSIVMLGLGLVLYRKRKLECAGDFLAFRRLIPFFTLIFTLTMGALFQIVGGLFQDSIVYMIVGLAVGCYASQMLLRRTVKVFDKKSLILCGAIVGSLALTLVVTAMDPMGLTRWIPEADQVEAIILSEDYEYDAEDEKLYGYVNSMTLTNADQIRELVEIHSLLTESGESGSQNVIELFNGDLGAVHLIYQLKDGREVERRYYYRISSDAGKRMEKFYDAPEFVLGYEKWEEFLKDIWYVEVDNLYGCWDVTEDCQGLLEAIRADLEQGLAPDMEGYNGDINVSISREWGKSSYLNITDRCTNTMAWLKENLPEVFDSDIQNPSKYNPL